MVFPKDVHKKIQEQNKLAGDNKAQLIVALFVLGNVVCFFGLNFLFSMALPKAPFSLTVIVQVLITVLVGIAAFRFLIFDENEKKKEYKGQQSDSFMKYMYLRKDIHRTIDINNHGVNVFEFENGTAVCVIEFRFGSNDDAKAAGTEDLYQQMVKTISDYGFEFRFVVMPENFKTSNEFNQYINAVNDIQTPELKKTIMEYTDEVMGISYEQSNVDALYLMIRSASNYQSAELDPLLRRLVKLMLLSANSFRDITFLDINQLLEFYREFYGIAAIDLAMMRTIELSKDIEEDFSKIVQIYSLSDYDGRIYKVKQGADMLAIKERLL